MTQSQQTHQEYLASLVFHSISSIVRWAGLPDNLSSVSFLDANKELPYVLRDETYYYFGAYPGHEYRLVAMSNKDIGE